MEATLVGRKIYQNLRLGSNVRLLSSKQKEQGFEKKENVKKKETGKEAEVAEKVEAEVVADMARGGDSDKLLENVKAQSLYINIYQQKAKHYFQPRKFVRGSFLKSFEPHFFRQIGPKRQFGA